LLSNMLRAHGFDVSAYYNLKSGLNAVKDVKPHWVIMDNNLPDGLGWEKTPEILSSDQSVQIINISANPDSKRDHNSERVHYLIKPIDVNSIVTLIRQSGS
jgi:two-component system, OmpR family, response regulator